MQIRATFKAALTCSAILAIPALAWAQDPAPVRVEQACKTEMASLCAATDGKQPRGIRCLTDNQAKLGAECATAIKNARERREKVQTACKADADKLCAGAQPKGGQFVACLRGKQAELSKPCADAIAALPQPAAKQ